MITPVNEALSVSREILRRNVSEKGLATSTDVYREVWARDSVISLFGATADRSPEMLEVLRVSLECLGSRQDRFGQIPFYVRLSDDKAEFGSADSTPWFVIGAAIYAERSGDRRWWTDVADAVIRALDWCESRDFTKVGLMESGECDDWADLLCNRGKVLFPNVLCAQALRVAARLLHATHPDEAKRFERRGAVVRDAIQRVFWVVPPDDCVDTTHYLGRLHASVTLRARPYFLPWASLFEYGDRFDTAGNLFAILCDVARDSQADAILDFIDQAGLDQPFPVRALYPAIQQGDKDWRDYYKVWGNNLPDQYHNGGIWPWIGGLYVAALVKRGRHERAASELGKLALALREGLEPWECREWIHARSGRGMGAKFQAWSAGMMLYAEHVLRTGAADGFDDPEVNQTEIHIASRA